MSEWFEGILRDHARVAVVGGPKSGKTTLTSGVADREVFRTDDAIALGWDAQPDHWITAASTQRRFVIEGIQVARALRKGLEVDAVVLLASPKRELRPAQVNMAKGVQTVLREWRAAHPDVPVYVQT